MKIKQITARQDVCAATKEKWLVCEVYLTNGVSGSAIAHCALSDSHSYLSIIENITQTISPFLEGKIIDVVECDTILEEIYEADETKVVPHAIINAISIAISKAQALAENIELFELFAELSQNETISIPYPFLHVYGTQTFKKSFPIQEVYLLPLGASSFRHSLAAWQELQKKLVTYSLPSLFEQAPEVLFESIDGILHEAKLYDVFVPAMQGKAHVLYDETTGNYAWLQSKKTSEEVFLFYKNLIEKFRVFSVQDGFALADILGARNFLEVFGDRVQLVSNQPFSFKDVPALQNLKTYSNAYIVKPEDYLTVTHALTHVMNIKQENINVIIESKYEDNISFVVDFAVGTSAGQIKASTDILTINTALSDRLLDIEDTMTFSLL